MATMIQAPSTEAQEKFDKLSTRLGELRAELGAVNGEISTILSALGALVGTGADYHAQTVQVSQLRQKSEALELGILYIQGQISLLERSHYGLSKR